MKKIFHSFAMQALRLLAVGICFATPIFGQIQIPEMVNDSNSQECMAKIYYHIKEDMITVGDSPNFHGVD